MTDYTMASIYKDNYENDNDNKNNKVLISSHIKVADTFFKRLKGLLGTKDLPSGKGLLIIPCKQVHTFFMRYNLDLIFLDEYNTIVHMIEDIPPFRISPYIKESEKVLELKAGTIKQYNLMEGEKLVIY
ncbi:putative ACR [Natranaerofaba carboxydovora]|nr:putative ACR [Natranaerofaba carboxydovora]